MASDRWGLIQGGECTDQSFAFMTICITNAAHILEMCLASVCALLATTDPECVVVLVNRWVYWKVRDIFAKNGVLVALSPEWAPYDQGHPYEHLQNRTYTFAKLEAFSFTQYQRIVVWDADALFTKNASALQNVQPFAAAKTFRGKFPNSYINSGVFVAKPDRTVYSALILRWREGRYKLHYSNGDNSEQDVLIDHCVIGGECGNFTDLDACVWNYGSWLPGVFPRTCDEKAFVLRHNFYATRERYLASALRAGMYRGVCRARAIFDQSNCFTRDFPRENCCRHEPGKALEDLDCWSSGFSFERCCGELNDTAWLRRELQYSGKNWYGPSSVPEYSTDVFSRQCWHKYSLTPMTYAVNSKSTHLRPKSENVTWWAVKCESVGGDVEEPDVPVQFSFRWLEYLQDFRNNTMVAVLRRRMELLTEDGWNRIHGKFYACVPPSCCTYTGVSSNTKGLHTVLWTYLIGLFLPAAGFCDVNYSVSYEEIKRSKYGLGRRLPPLPFASHFTEIVQISASNRSFTCSGHG